MKTKGLSLEWRQDTHAWNGEKMVVFGMKTKRLVLGIKTEEFSLEWGQTGSIWRDRCYLPLDHISWSRKGPQTLPMDSGMRTLTLNAYWEKQAESGSAQSTSRGAFNAKLRCVLNLKHFRCPKSGCSLNESRLHVLRVDSLQLNSNRIQPGTRQWALNDTLVWTGLKWLIKHSNDIL